VYCSYVSCAELSAVPPVMKRPPLRGVYLVAFCIVHFIRCTMYDWKRMKVSTKIVAICLLPAMVANAGIVFNVSVCLCVCMCMYLSKNQRVVLETCLVVDPRTPAWEYFYVCDSFCWVSKILLARYHCNHLRCRHETWWGCSGSWDQHASRVWSGVVWVCGTSTLNWVFSSGLYICYCADSAKMGPKCRNPRRAVNVFSKQMISDFSFLNFCGMRGFAVCC